MNIQRRVGFTLIEIMIVVAIIGLLTAIAVPNLQQTIAEARQKACALNRKNIDAAKLRWSVEHQSPLTATPTDSDLFGQDAYLEHKPNCPASGSYALNSVQEKCTCSYSRHGN